MPAPSTYLEATQTRLHDRSALLLRDINIMVVGLAGKATYLWDLRQQFLKHRLEDTQQIRDARAQTWASWDERVHRVEEWMKEAADAARASATLRAWKESARGFERLQGITDKFTASLTHRAEKVERDYEDTADLIHQWDGRLRAQEAEMRAFLERQAVRGTELMVSKARKQPFLDFAIHERESEARLSAGMKNLRATANRMIDRIAKAQTWVSARAEQSPGYFDDRKQEFVVQLARHRSRYIELREKIMNLALFFEEGRQRLRWVYEQVQRMRVVQDAASENKPLLHRLFGIDE